MPRAFCPTPSRAPTSRFSPSPSGGTGPSSFHCGLGAGGGGGGSTFFAARDFLGAAAASFAGGSVVTDRFARGLAAVSVFFLVRAPGRFVVDKSHSAHAGPQVRRPKTPRRAGGAGWLPPRFSIHTIAWPPFARGSVQNGGVGTRDMSGHGI